MEDYAASKIQFLFKLNSCKQSLKFFNDLKLLSFAENNTFEQFQHLIVQKNVINITQKLTDSLEKFKKGLNITPKILISSYIIYFYPNEIFSEEKHPIDNNIIEHANNVIKSLENNNILELWTNLKDYKYNFNNFMKHDKNRTIEQIIVSYYYRMEHINKINSENAPNKIEMLFELETQRKELIKSLKIIDKTFDIKYLEENYESLYISIQNGWEQMADSLTKNMKKAYYDMLNQDLENGETLSCENLIQDIKERLFVICPEKYKQLFETNFKSVPYVSSENSKFREFILMMVDFILLMDSPINDQLNNSWRQQIIELNDIPRILIEIEERCDLFCKTK